ncbi:hypothetical protein ACTD5D_41175 [Nocardia takedensis]|uniref:hypothetical protein n=1 Tax=Nocardia takedensis TaxID=259390 RepID=UPI003F765322
MIGPVLQTDARTAQAGRAAFGKLPAPVQGALLVFAVLAGMVGCSAAWLDQQHYQPSPNVCRPDQVPYAAQLGCAVQQQVPRTIPTPAGWER